MDSRPLSSGTKTLDLVFSRGFIGVMGVSRQTCDSDPDVDNLSKFSPFRTPVLVICLDDMSSR